MRNRYRINSPEGAIFPKVSDCIRELELHPERYHKHISIYCGEVYYADYYLVKCGDHYKTVKEVIK